jgi:rubredoxin
MAQRIDLHAAWVWDCPECGVENFERSIISALSDEEEEHMHEVHGLPPNETGFWQTAPEEVICGECQTEFKVFIDLPGNEYGLE